MLIKEAQWIRQQFDRIETHLLSPMLDIGGSTQEFRATSQPWINDYVFDPLDRRGVAVLHLDILPGEGVDIVGDITDQAVIADLVNQRIQAVICTNLLEHVREVEPICASIEAVVSPGGYILVTVPRRFPYHPDPIDTMFRPDIDQVQALFPRSRAISSATVNCGTFWDYVVHTFRVTLPWVVRHSATFDKRSALRGVIGFLGSLFVSSEITCVLLQKEAGPAVSPFGA